MSVERIDSAQLTGCQLSELVQVVYDNIEVGRYYYVREREPGETHYDLYGCVSSRSDHRVRLAVYARRRINADGAGEGAWEDLDNDDEVYVAERDLINSVEQDMSSRYYLPLEAASAS